MYSVFKWNLPQHTNTSKKDKILQRPDNKNSKWLKSPNDILTAHGALCFHKETKRGTFPSKKTQKQRRILWVDTQVSFVQVSHTAKKPKTNSDTILTCSTCCTLTVGSLFLHWHLTFSYTTAADHIKHCRSLLCHLFVNFHFNVNTNSQRHMHKGWYPTLLDSGLVVSALLVQNHISFCSLSISQSFCFKQTRNTKHILITEFYWHCKAALVNMFIQILKVHNNTFSSFSQWNYHTITELVQSLYEWHYWHS